MHVTDLMGSQVLLVLLAVCTERTNNIGEMSHSHNNVFPSSPPLLPLDFFISASSKSSVHLPTSFQALTQDSSPARHWHKYFNTTRRLWGSMSVRASWPPHDPHFGLDNCAVDPRTLTGILL